MRLTDLKLILGRSMGFGFLGWELKQRKLVESLELKRKKKAAMVSVRIEKVVIFKRLKDTHLGKVRGWE